MIDAIAPCILAAQNQTLLKKHHYQSMEAIDILKTNTKAVRLMQKGDYLQAIALLRAALTDLLGIVQDRPAAEEDSKMLLVGGGGSTADRQDAKTLLVDSNCVAGYRLCRKRSFYQDHHAFSLFDRALCIRGVEASDLTSISAQNAISATVLYNMGLAHQLQGMQSLTKQKACFKKALKLYQMASDILKDCSADDGEVSGLLYLAVCNNMGHIYSHFCETQNAQRCLQWLQTILEACQSIDLGLPEDEYLPFYLNVLILHGQDTVAAAAA